MSTKLTNKEIEHLAHLARLELSAEELELYSQQLTEVINYNIDLLNKLDVSNIEPTSQTTGLANVWRQDEVGDSLSQQDALDQAPRSSQGYFVVPAVLDGE